MAPVTDPSVLAMFERLNVEFYTAARSRPWADIKVDDDLLWGATGIPHGAFNGATGAAFTEANADARIERVLGYFRELRLDMTWWIGPTSTPADLGTRLIAHGLKAEAPVPGMAAPLDGWQPPPVPAELVVRRVTDDAAFHAVTEVMFAGFEMPAELVMPFEERFREFCVGPRAIQQTFLGTIDGRAVATSLGMIVDDTIGIFNVATLPDARRRGYGAAVTAAAMAHGQAGGARRAILESSPMGRSVYESLGFRQVCEVTVFEGHFSGDGPPDPAA